MITNKSGPIGTKKKNAIVARIISILPYLLKLYLDFPYALGRIIYRRRTP